MLKKNAILCCMLLNCSIANASPWTDFYNIKEDRYYPTAYKDKEISYKNRSTIIKGLYLDSNDINQAISSDEYRTIYIFSDTININQSVMANVSGKNIFLMARKIVGEKPISLNIYNDGISIIKILSDDIDVDLNINDLDGFHTVLSDSGRNFEYIKMSDYPAMVSQNDRLDATEFIEGIVDNTLTFFDQSFDAGSSIFDQSPSLSTSVLNWNSNILGQSEKLFQEDSDFSNLYNSFRSMELFVKSNQKVGNYLPTLNMNVYSEEYNVILSSMESYQREFDNFKDRKINLAERKESAKLMLDHLNSALDAQQSIINNKNKKIDTYNKIVSDRAIEFAKQKDLVDEKAVDFKEGLISYTVHETISGILNSLSIIADIGSGIISAYTGNVGEIADTASEMADKVDETASLAKNLKRVAENIDNIKKLVGTLNSIIEMIRNQMYNADLREQMKSINLALPELESSALSWQLTQQDIDTQLSIAESFSIPGAKQYHAALNKLMTWGSAISGTQLALIQMSANVVELEFEKKAIMEDIARIETLIDNIGTDQEAMLDVEKYLLRSYNFFKRPLYLAQLNYNAAYKYTTFEDSKVTPKLNATYLEYNKDRISLERQFNDYAANLSGYAQNFQKWFKLNDQDAIESFKKTGEISINITPDNYTTFGEGYFRGENRIRLKTFGVQLIGSGLPETLYRFQISHSGQFTDLYRGEVFKFNGTTMNRFFSYTKEGDTYDIHQNGDFENEYTSFIFNPSLMTNWTIKLQNHADIDLSKLENIKIFLNGSSMTTPWRRDQPKL